MTGLGSLTIFSIISQHCAKTRGVPLAAGLRAHLLQIVAGAEGRPGRRDHDDAAFCRRRRGRARRCIAAISATDSALRAAGRLRVRRKTPPSSASSRTGLAIGHRPLRTVSV